MENRQATKRDRKHFSLFVWDQARHSHHQQIHVCQNTLGNDKEFLIDQETRERQKVTDN
jgi:hypothetical protein